MTEDKDMQAIFALADRLHKTVAEVLEMSLSEFIGWIAYLHIVHEEQKRGQKSRG